MRAVALQSGTRRGRTAADNQSAAAAIRAAEEKAYKKLYGDLLPSVDLLRRRGFVVTREKAGFRVGNKLLDADGMRAMAARESSLDPASAGVAAPVRKVKVAANGHRIGETIAIAPKVKPLAAAPRALSGVAAAAKAKAAEHSTDLGTRPRVVWLDLGLLEVDKRYQREINQGGAAHINRILKAFNWNCFQPVIVTERADGTYAVIDGQHRLEAAKKHPLIDSLPCYIIDAPDVAQQAAIFVAVNSVRKGLNNLQKFWASVAAGDREAKALVKACEDASVTIPRTAPQGGLHPRTLIGPNIALRLVGKFGRQAVIDALKLLAEAWPQARTGFRIANLGAVAAIASIPYSRNRLLGALKGVDPDRLYVDALALAGESSVKAMAASIEKLIRKAMTGRPNTG